MAENGKHTPPAQRNLSRAICLEGDCNNGHGVMMYENDTKCVGQSKIGDSHGKGIYYWRTGKALEGEFDDGWLKPRGHHISPDGRIVVHGIRRGLHNTYAEEESAAKWNYVMEHKGEMLLREMIRSIKADRKAKEEYCGGRFRKEVSPDWYSCDQ